MLEFTLKHFFFALVSTAFSSHPGRRVFRFWKCEVKKVSVTFERQLWYTSLHQRMEGMRDVHPLFPLTPLVLPLYSSLSITVVPQHFRPVTEL